MDAQRPISVSIVNKYYPPDASVTSEAASDLGQYLVSKGFDVQIVSSTSKYDGGGATGAHYGTVHRVKSRYDGKNKILRLLASIIESWSMIRKVSSLGCDTNIIMTSPPLLNFFASRIFYRKKQNWIYWSMDLYPEAFEANKLVGRNNAIYKFVRSQSYKHTPELLLALGDIQAEYLRQQFNSDIPYCKLPCGVFLNSDRKDELGDGPEWKSEKDKIYLGYIGNLGEAHSVTFLKSIIKNFDPEKYQMVLVVYGSKADELLDFAKAYTSKLIIKKFVPREQLSHIDIHLVSLMPDWVNICVPSKLVSAVYKGSAFIFYGPEHSDSWQYLKQGGWLINAENVVDNQTIELLDNIDHHAIADKKANAQTFSPQMLEEVKLAYMKLANYLTEKYA